MKYHGKFESPGKGRRMTKVAALALALVLLVSAGGTLAYLFTSTDPVENTFSPAEMGIVIHEKFENNVKSNVYVENTSEVDVYIRAAIVINWKDDAGNVIAEVPTASDYALDINKTDWKEDGGYYYWITATEKSVTANLINSAKPITQKAGYHLSIDILAQAIQAEPANAVTDAWGEISGLATIAAAE